MLGACWDRFRWYEVSEKQEAWNGGETWHLNRAATSPSCLNNLNAKLVVVLRSSSQSNVLNSYAEADIEMCSFVSLPFSELQGAFH